MTATVAIRAEAVSRRFGDEVAVDRVDLDVRAGEIQALVGLNGAGKTTLMRMLLGMLHPDTGRVVLNVGGREVPLVGLAPRDWRQVGHLIETPLAYGELTVVETVRTAARLHGLNTASARSAADAVVADLALAHWADRRNHTLSLGNRQRVGLACAVVHEPTVLVLDEPTNGLDPAGVIVVRERLLRSARSGAAVLVSSHHLDEVARIADRITVVHRGRVVGTLPPGGFDLERAFFAMVYEAESAGQGPA
ncbi:MAG: ABC transporter ATP-binding protein [Candidatus Nanopelagicales bacterium]